MYSIESFEPFADECKKIFFDSIKDLEGQRVDLGACLQWYAFDVIGAITFQQRFGFMEQRKDVQNMIADLEVGLRYAGVAGQVPSLHSWIIGDIWVGKFLAMQPFVHAPDPLRTIVQARIFLFMPYALYTDSWTSSLRKIALMLMIVNLLPNIATDRAFLLGFKMKKRRANRYSRQAVMKEAMRCHPGVSYPLERVVPEGGTTLCGVYLEAGTIVGMNPAVIHHDKSIFGDDAAKFRPER
ncbi:cytochrome P450 [Penicillium malachiteum]|uniref:Cytochrome P450 n=1 Tax=Penicillium malachiteum TaxID=1324776 RepID=A0AAD6HHY7_9EURO|nr:cytochrome P450 [Penicillium malachiteum]